MNDGKSALIIEDNAILCDILQSALKTCCTDVVCCKSFSDVLEIIGRRTFDIFIVDYRLPSETGAEITNVLRSVFPQSYIVGMSIETRENEFLDAGANAFLLKPFDLDVLLSLVECSAT